ncbi:MAG: ribosome biogenesis factor YjgA [Pseudomonadota bacterium]
MDNDDEDFISKTRRKTAMLDLQALGVELVDLSKERLAQLNLPENLLQAIAEAKRINKHGALKRQRQYIGRLMRDVDPAPLREMMESWQQPSRAAIAQQHLAERWRERLIADDQEFTAFAAEFSGTDMSRLRQLARNAREEREREKPPRAFRELYRILHGIITNSSSANDEKDSAEEDSSADE